MLLQRRVLKGAKDTGAKAVSKKPSAPSLMESATVIKCKNGWILKRVPRGSSGGKKGPSYPLYRARRQSTYYRISIDHANSVNLYVVARAVVQFLTSG